MTEITTNQLEQILDLLGEGNERVADAREMLQKITKPKPKPADMSVFVGQPVLCEFWDDNSLGPKTGFITEVDGCAPMDPLSYRTEGDLSWRKYAQPKFGYWQAMRNVKNFEHFYRAVTGAGFEVDFDISIFRITGYRDGFGPEWECR